MLDFTAGSEGALLVLVTTLIFLGAFVFIQHPPGAARLNDDPALIYLKTALAEWQTGQFGSRNLVEDDGPEAAAAHVLRLIKGGLFRALSPEEALAALGCLLAEGQQLAAERRKLLAFLSGRSYIVLGLALLGRLFLLSIQTAMAAPQPLPLALVDALSLAAALSLTFLGRWLVWRFFPSDWFWAAGRFTAEGRLWLMARFLDEAPPGSQLAVTWQRLRLAEAQSGRVQTAARLLALSVWEREQAREQELKRQSFEDALPLYDLLALGLPALGLLAAPALRLVPLGPLRWVG